MMGVYVNSMEMPTSCDMCWALDDYGDYPRCRITEEQRGYNFPVREQRMSKCPLVPVPPHGDLIDRDALMDSDGDLWDGMWGWSGVQIANAPTIIPAEEGE